MEELTLVEVEEDQTLLPKEELHQEQVDLVL
jgi:hypothetical protein